MTPATQALSSQLPPARLHIPFKLMTRKLFAAGFAIAAACLVSAQVASSYCDATSDICFQGYTDTAMDMTIGIVLPPLATPPSDEYIVQMVVPASYGWSGISMGGQMTNSLLVPFWPNGEDIVLGPRWADDYILPTAYTGPTITLLPVSTVNSTHVNAIFRCQNCTVWDGGSLGSGNLNGTAVFAYAASTTTGVDDPSDVNSSFSEHDYFNFFGMDLSAAHSSSYGQYVSGGAGSTTVPLAPSSTPATPSSTSSAPAATQTEFGQCGGTGWAGPTVCAAGLTCVAVSPPYYSQCQAST